MSRGKRMILRWPMEEAKTSLCRGHKGQDTILQISFPRKNYSFPLSYRLQVPLRSLNLLCRLIARVTKVGEETGCMGQIGRAHV